MTRSTSTTTSPAGRAGAVDVILFDGGLIDQQILLANGQIVITDDVAILGLDRSRFTLAGNQVDRLFEIDAAAETWIRSLTVTDGGVTGSGGAFCSGADLGGSIGGSAGAISKPTGPREFAKVSLTRPGRSWRWPW